jgi:hypothetical protein
MIVRTFCGGTGSLATGVSFARSVSMGGFEVVGIPFVSHGVPSPALWKHAEKVRPERGSDHKSACDNAKH